MVSSTGSISRRLRSAMMILKSLPDVAEAFEIFAPLAALVQPADDAPIAQGPQAHAGIPPADVQALHHVIGAQRDAADVEQGVDLGHGAVDAPGLAHLPPAADEQVLGRMQLLLDHFHCHRVTAFFQYLLNY